MAYSAVPEHFNRANPKYYKDQEEYVPCQVRSDLSKTPLVHGTLWWTYKKPVSLVIFNHKFAIKRNCDIKDYFDPWIGQSKLLMKYNERYVIFC